MWGIITIYRILCRSIVDRRGYSVNFCLTRGYFLPEFVKLWIDITSAYLSVVIFSSGPNWLAIRLRIAVDTLNRNRPRSSQNAMKASLENRWNCFSRGSLTLFASYNIMILRFEASSRLRSTICINPSVSLTAPSFWGGSLCFLEVLLWSLCRFHRQQVNGEFLLDEFRSYVRRAVFLVFVNWAICGPFLRMLISLKMPA